MKTEKLSYFNGNITIDSDICNGKPTIRGQRITVQTILEFLSVGESWDEILKAYPTLTKEDVKIITNYKKSHNPSERLSTLDRLVAQSNNKIMVTREIATDTDRMSDDICKY